MRMNTLNKVVTFRPAVVDERASPALPTQCARALQSVSPPLQSYGPPPPWRDVKGEGIKIEMDHATAMDMIRARQMLPAKQTIELASENLRKVCILLYRNLSGRYISTRTVTLSCSFSTVVVDPPQSRNVEKCSCCCAFPVVVRPVTARKIAAVC